jgi:dienelactone hydrolase
MELKSRSGVANKARCPPDLGPRPAKAAIRAERRRYPARINPDASFVPDTERWISPWLEVARSWPGVDPGAVTLLGISFGGYFVLRAAAGDSSGLIRRWRLLSKPDWDFRTRPGY